MEEPSNSMHQASLNIKYSVVAFVSGLAPVFWTIFLPSNWTLELFLYQVLTTSIASLIFGKLLFPNVFDIWWRACLIGYGVTFGLFLLTAPDLQSFGAYFVILSVFHYLEYAVTGLTNPSNLSTDSFLLNHSLQYWLAAVLSWCEYFAELYFFPSLKSKTWIYAIGIAICVAGDILRKLAMFHAGNSFCHIVQSSKKDDHDLVTSGVFSLVRHPSYVGWFIWSLGTQVVLANPICFVIYTIVSWLFFQERIYIEEYNLLQFFGQDYKEYQDQVPVGIPFIKGFQV